MATSFFLQIVLGFGIACLAHYLSGKTYWWSTSHPISRLPVFFMGICAGVLCVRIQNGDLDALNRKNDCLKITKYNTFVCNNLYFQNLVERVKIGSFHIWKIISCPFHFSGKQKMKRYILKSNRNHGRDVLTLTHLVILDC